MSRINTAPPDPDDPPGTLSETHLAALREGLTDLPRGAVLVGVTRNPVGGLRNVVDENRDALGPPSDVLEEFRGVREDYKMRGLCEEEAHNSAWLEVDFERRYLDHLEKSKRARDDWGELVEWLRGGKDVVLVCYEGENRRCHRHLLREYLLRRLKGEAD